MIAHSLNRLSALAVRSLPAGKHSDGGGLWLFKRDSDAGQWVLRYTLHGRRREMGLGPTAEVSLKQAREDATKWRAAVRTGLDPIREREREKREAVKRLHTLEDVARDAFESRKAELKGDGKAGRWFSPLELHIIPKLGKTPIAELGQTDIRDALAPIWHSKADTARKAMNRLNITFKHAAALGLEVDIQAPSKARALLGQQRHVATNIPAMPWQDVPAFYATLDEPTIAHLALRLTILTGVRSAPLRQIHESQIDGDVWTIPGEAMKGKKGKTPDFRVPLSPEAQTVIDLARLHTKDGFLFPNIRKGVLSDATMARLMERREIPYRPHGFRSSLRDWIAETTETPYEIAETVLGHVVGGKVERAYRRTDYLDKRRKLLERWAQYVTGKSGNVIQLVAEA